jgi:tetratricopeptide (TPR) repeat protein
MVVYRSALQLLPGHGTALERLGRVYLRYRETIPAAVQCFFKSVETNPSNHVAWYLLGRCYMATAQYSDAFEAYSRAVNLNPNDPQIWCSLGVLYYAFGQYRESLGMLARALKLEPSMADAWYNVGALYDMVDQPDDAQLAYMKARENGLADRFARAGMGVNPLSAQHMPRQSFNASNAVNGEWTDLTWYVSVSVMIMLFSSTAAVDRDGEPSCCCYLCPGP